MHNRHTSSGLSNRVAQRVLHAWRSNFFQTAQNVPERSSSFIFIFRFWDAPPVFRKIESRGSQTHCLGNVFVYFSLPHRSERNFILVCFCSSFCSSSRCLIYLEPEWSKPPKRRTRYALGWFAAELTDWTRANEAGKASWAAELSDQIKRRTESEWAQVRDSNAGVHRKSCEKSKSLSALPVSSSGRFELT